MSKKTYAVIPGTPVVAVQLRFDDMVPLRYTKWDADQAAKHGDWLIAETDGRGSYTCEESVFNATYQATDVRGQYQKFGTVEAEIATEDGAVKTLEGSTSYKAGDYIVTNSTGEQYAMSAAKFEARYRLVDES